MVVLLVSTRESLRAIRRVLPTAIRPDRCARHGHRQLGVSAGSWRRAHAVEGYLATSPGGVNDVLVAAVEIGSTATCCGSESDSAVGRSSRPARHSSASGTDGPPAQRVGLESRR